MTSRYMAAFFSILLQYQAKSQAALPDSVDGQTATATALFIQALQTGKAIYNGPEHVEYLPTIEGLPYFGSKAWQTSAVQYDGLVYPSEALLYDLVKDQLVVRRPDGFAVELRSDKVAWFRLGGHLFVWQGAQNSAGLPPGFYDQLVTGALTVLAKRRIVYEERVEETTLRQRFLDQTTYYAIQNNRVVPIRTFRSLLDLTGRQKSAIQQQVRKAGIKFKKDREGALAAAARYYNQTQP